MTERPRFRLDARRLGAMLSCFWSPLVMYLLHLFLARVVHAYAAWPRLDVPMHFLGGVVITMSFHALFVFLQNENAIDRLHRALFFLLLFCLAVTAAVFWEFAEFIQDYYFDTNSQVSMVNIMRDLFVGVVGSLAAILVLWLRQRALRSGKGNDG